MDRTVSAASGGSAHADRRPQPGAAGGLVQLRERYMKLQELVTRLGQETVASVVLLVDGSGQSVAHWYRMGEIDVAAIAALTAGSMVARQALSLQLNGSARQSTVVHEYDDQLVVLMRVDANLVLLVVMEDMARLGWARVALKRAAGQVAALNAED